MKSLRARVLAGAGLVLAVFILLTAAALDRAFYQSALAAQRERLLGQVYLLMGGVDVSDEGVSVPPDLPVPRLMQPGSGLYAYVIDTGGAVVWRSPSTAGFAAPAISPLAPGEQSFSENLVSPESGEGFLLQAYGVSWDTGQTARRFTFVIVSDRQEFLAEVSMFRHTLWGWLGVMAFLLLVGQGLILHWGLRPLRQVVGELRAIEAAEQGQLRGTYPLEIQRLTDPINALLKQERARQTRYRDALSDLAHSLKTPLAVLRGALGDQRNEGKPAEGDLAGIVDEQVGRMDGIVQHQLQRAATAGRSATPRKVLLRPVGERLLEALKKVYRDKPVSVQVEMDPGLQVWADEGDLTECLGNLLDNAFKWCQGRVLLFASREGNGISIRIEDDGPGVPEGQSESFLARGVRADLSRPGQGIGLAVVQDIVRAYEGSLRFDRSALGGASVKIQLPIA